jgi:hypothetical protein
MRDREPNGDGAPKVGRAFLHRYWLTADHAPLRCRITAVRQGMVYWKALDDDGKPSGNGMCCETGEFASKVKSWL